MATLVHAVVGCGSGLEVSTTAAVDVFLLPKRPGVEGNKRVAVLPAGKTIEVRREVLDKDMAAYEIEYVDPGSKEKVNGFVLLGTPGLQVRKRAQN
jgi:hypothetical protein